MIHRIVLAIAESVRRTRRGLAVVLLSTVIAGVGAVTDALSADTGHLIAQSRQQGLMVYAQPNAEAWCRADLDLVIQLSPDSALLESGAESAMPSIGAALEQKCPQALTAQLRVVRSDQPQQVIDQYSAARAMRWLPEPHARLLGTFSQTAPIPTLSLSLAPAVAGGGERSLQLVVSGVGKSARQGERLDLEIPAGTGIGAEVTAFASNWDPSQLTVKGEFLSLWASPLSKARVIWYLDQSRLEQEGDHITLKLAKGQHRLEAQVEDVWTALYTPRAISPPMSSSPRVARVDIHVNERTDWACLGRLGTKCKDGDLTEVVTSESEVSWDATKQQYVIKGKMSVGAIKHDKCCAEAGPQGFRCGGGILGGISEVPSLGKTPCEKEWEQATWDRTSVLLLPNAQALWPATWSYSPAVDQAGPKSSESWWKGVAPEGSVVGQQAPQADAVHCQSGTVKQERVMSTLKAGLVTGPANALQDHTETVWVCDAVSGTQAGSTTPAKQPSQAERGGSGKGHVGDGSLVLLRTTAGNLAANIVLPVGEPKKMPLRLTPNANGYIDTSDYLDIYDDAWHSGVDLAGRAGADVRAIADGTVVDTRVGFGGGFGNALLIKHDGLPGGATHTQYCHMEDGSVDLKKGGPVTAGQVIGRVGSTGRSTGPHLHFEVKRVDAFGHGYFNVKDANNVFEARRCSNDSIRECTTNAECEAPGTCDVKASSEDYFAPLEYLAAYADIEKSSAFVEGDIVRVKVADTNVRNTPKGAIAGTQSSVSSLGGVVDGPTYAGGYWWWKVDFESGADGWVAEQLLTKTSCDIGTPFDNVIVPAVERIVSYRGSGFDATRTTQATWIGVNGTEHLYYAGVPFSNRQDLGLAISTNSGRTWSKVSSTPLVPQVDKPYWATQRIVPVRAFHEGGLYRLWYGGNNTNLFTDTDNIEGFGYAESSDGVHWRLSDEPIRAASGSGEGARLLEVVKLGNTYLAYYWASASNQPWVMYLARSSDGKTFVGPDKPVAFGDEYKLAAGASRAGHNGCFLGIWKQRDTGAYVATTSTNGMDFQIVSNIAFPPEFAPEDIVIDGNDITFFGALSEGNVNWSYGNASMATARVPFFKD